MRTSLLAGLFAAFALPACANEISGIDDTTGADAGVDAAVDPVAPRIDMSVDKTTLSTELLTTQTIVVTLTSVNGFAGAATLTASVVDAANTPLAGWTATLDMTSVNLVADGSATVEVDVKVPTLYSGPTGTVKIDATSTAAPATVSSTFNVANQITYRLSVNAGACVYPLEYGKMNSRDRIAVGTKVRWFNEGTTNFEIHITGGDAYGFSHQAQGTFGTADPVTEMNTAYEQTAMSSSGGALIQWYCHDPDTGTANAGYFEVM